MHVSHRRWRLLDVERMRALHLWPRGGGAPTPFDDAAAGEVGRRLEAALGRLPVAWREALLLVTVEPFEPHQAAAILGLSPDAARQRIARARAALREALGEGPGRVSVTQGEAT
jgi:RNA polymerase sigma-70 factor (ECF subfamily)